MTTKTMTKPETRPTTEKRRQAFTLIEVIMTAAITAVLMISLSGILLNTLTTTEQASSRNDLVREARFAMERMVRAVSRTERLIVPMGEDAATGNSESIWDPGVLAVTLDPTLDTNLDGIVDADNDGDGRVDEDLGNDAQNDYAPGIVGVDDDNSGVTDISFGGDGDDDETGIGSGEDPIDGIDNDGDGTIDEDPSADMNGDGEPGIAGVDDDGDGSIDEGNFNDDDEDGQMDEDWYDVVVFSLSGSDLIERHPNLDPIDGRDYTERILVGDVAAFRIERLERGTRRADLVEISLTLSADGETVALQQRVRAGGSK